MKAQIKREAVSEHNDVAKPDDLMGHLPRITRTKMRVGRFSAVSILTGVLLAGGAATIAWAAGGSRLVMNGTEASTNVRMINGRPYVPLADVARAQGMVVVPITGGYEIKKAGGATPIAGLRGKVGDVLFDGKWRFQVLSVNKVDAYTMKYKSTLDYAITHSITEYDTNTSTFRPKAGRVLIAIKCRVTNARNATYSLWIYNNDTHTALADTSGESNPPFGYDMDESEPYNSKKLLPGAKTDFTVLFSVPEGTTPKDLVFTLRTINDHGNDARVALGG